jgi:hypothetical protein
VIPQCCGASPQCCGASQQYCGVSQQYCGILRAASEHRRLIFSTAYSEEKIHPKGESNRRFAGEEGRKNEALYWNLFDFFAFAVKFLPKPGSFPEHES